MPGNLAAYAIDGPVSSIIRLFKDGDFPQQAVTNCQRESLKTKNPRLQTQNFPRCTGHREKEEANVPVDGYTEKWPDLCDRDKESCNTKLHMFRSWRVTCNVEVPLNVGPLSWKPVICPSVLLGDSYQHLAVFKPARSSTSWTTCSACQRRTCLTRKSLIYGELLK